ncbi:MAG: glycosyltransferase family 2 protein [Gammaproteobacteria bacterium]|nr:MAG: glycosyltransferase family 2 protein [Gammaproteobacteria bacterium]
MNAPLISVVIVFLDAARHLEAAIESVRAQTWTDWELVLVDDGSTDAGTALARAWAAREPQRIRYVEHAGHANLGISASRNAGVAAARGAWVAFLDADDLWLPERLERHAAVIDAEPGVRLVQSCLEYWHSWAGDGTADETELAPFGACRGRIEPPRALLLLLATRGATAPGICSVTIRRADYLALGGCEPAFRNLFEDQVLLAKLYLEHPVYVMPDVLARYRQHPASLVGQVGEAGLHAARRTHLEWLETWLAGRGAVDTRVSRALRRALFEYRYPRLWALGQAPHELYAGLRRIGFAALPAPLAARVRGWWRQRKRRGTARLLARHRDRLT